MTSKDDVAAIRSERLQGVIQIWLWEFEDPENWPSGDQVAEMIESLERRADAASENVQRAIAECRDYLQNSGV
jgi:hypothetical protein